MQITIDRIYLLLLTDQVTLVKVTNYPFLIKAFLTIATGKLKLVIVIKPILQ